MNGYEWKRSSGFGGNLVEEATLDVETLPKVKHLPSLCNERAEKKNCIFSPFITLANQGQKELLCFLEGKHAHKELKVALQPALQKAHGWAV